MLKQTVFNLDENLRTQFKLATIQRRTTIKAVLTDMVKKYVKETDISYTFCMENPTDGLFRNFDQTFCYAPGILVIF